MRIFLLLTATTLLLAGCAHKPPRSLESTDPSRCVPLGQWLNIGEKRIVPTTAALDRFERQQVVLLGEDHDNAQHHRWQLHTLIQLYARQPKLALGFEAFPRRVQPFLNQWIAGELTEQAFLDAVDWQRIWNYDAEYYLPMLRFARMNRIPVYALNVDRELISRIGREGWENIPEQARQGVTDPAPASPDYIESLNEIFGQHMPSGDHPGSDQHSTPAETANRLQTQGFQRFLQSQLVWDRSMAEISRKALDDGAQLMVAIVGAGHLMGGYGIPHQLKAMGTERVVSLLPWDGAIDCDQLQPGLADLAFGMRPPEPKTETEKPRLGVYLEPAEQGVRISRVVPGSIAETLGVQADDIIVEMAGKPVTRITDVIESVKNTAFGTWLPFSVERQGDTHTLVAKFPAKTSP